MFKQPESTLPEDLSTQVTAFVAKLFLTILKDFSLLFLDVKV